MARSKTTTRTDSPAPPRWSDRDYRLALAYLKGYRPLREPSGRYDLDNNGNFIFMKDATSNAPKMFKGLTNKAGFSLTQKSPLKTSVKRQIRKLERLLHNTVANPNRSYTLVTSGDKEVKRALKNFTGIKSAYVKAYPIPVIGGLKHKIKANRHVIEIDYFETGTTHTLVPVRMRDVLAGGIEREEIDLHDAADDFVREAFARAEAGGVDLNSKNMTFRMLSEAGDISASKYGVVNDAELLIDNVRRLIDRYHGDSPDDILSEFASHRLSGIAIWDNSRFQKDMFMQRKTPTAWKQHQRHYITDFTQPNKHTLIPTRRKTGRNDGRRYEQKPRKKKR